MLLGLTLQQLSDLDPMALAGLEAFFHQLDMDHRSELLNYAALISGLQDVEDYVRTSVNLQSSIDIVEV